MPSRVKRRKRGAKKAEGHQHPELVGLALLALGVFLGFVVWADWNGGYVGLWIGEGLDALIGSATLGLPAALAIVGALMVARSDLVDVRPFRTGHRRARLRADDHARQGRGRLRGHAARRRARAGDRLDRRRDRRDPDPARRRRCS